MFSFAISGIKIDVHLNNLVRFSLHPFTMDAFFVLTIEFLKGGCNLWTFFVVGVHDV